MAEPCDCLNDCGDDERVGQYLVEPCAHALTRAKRKLETLQAEVDLRADAARYRWLRDSPESSGILVDMFNASVEDGYKFDAEIDAEIAASTPRGSAQ